MPVAFNIKLNETDVAKLKALTLGIKNGTPKALSRAINDTLRGARTDMVQQAYDTYNLTKTRIRKNIDVRKFSSFTDLSGRVSAVGESVRFLENKGSTFNFGVSRAVLKTGGISAKILRNGSREKWKRAFLATMKSGAIGYFQRKEIAPGRYVGRLPITQLTGPAIESAFSVRQYPAAMPTVQNKVQLRTDNNLQKQIDLEWSKF